jgi:hypothetical protein
MSPDSRLSALADCRSMVAEGTHMDSVAILWDVENVTPSTDKLFVNGLLDYADGLGRVSIAMAYADWTRDFLKRISETLAENSFELVHVPKSRKNSSDMTLITQALELIHQYPHIKKIILVTGDADFRPLLHALRKHAIEVHVICDAKSASEDLLILADQYKDYRELIADADEGEEEDRDKQKLSFEESMRLLTEAVGILIKRRQNTSIGAVKVRMKLLNDNFDEGDFGCKSWKQYVMKAAGRGAVKIDFQDNEMFLGLPEQTRSEAAAQAIEFPDVMEQFVQAVKASAQKSGREGWASYSTVNQLLMDRKVDVRKAGYKQFKKLVLAAEKRGLVETRNDGQHWYVKASEE